MAQYEIYATREDYNNSQTVFVYDGKNFDDEKNGITLIYVDRWDAINDYHDISSSDFKGLASGIYEVILFEIAENGIESGILSKHIEIF